MVEEVSLCIPRLHTSALGQGAVMGGTPLLKSLILDILYGIWLV